MAALDNHLDTLSSYQKEFRQYRDQQIRPLLIPQNAMEDECQKYYAQMGIYVMASYSEGFCLSLL